MNAHTNETVEAFRVQLKTGCGPICVIAHGRRRYFPYAAIAARYDYLPLQTLSHEDIANIPLGADLPRIGAFTPETPQQMRDQLVSGVSGQGLEFGAGARPVRFPIAANIRYVDRFNDDEMVQQSSSARELGAEGSGDPVFMPIDIVDSFDEMRTIGPSSQDFIYAGHVIEHVKDPIGAILRALDCLKPGGQLLLTVPDRNKTFDRNRPVSSLGRLLQIHLGTAGHFDSYFDRLFYVQRKGRSFKELIEQARTDMKNFEDIHFHTFTPASFKRLLSYVQEVSPGTECEVLKSDSVGGTEFYVRITKQG